MDHTHLHSHNLIVLNRLGAAQVPPWVSWIAPIKEMFELSAQPSIITCSAVKGPVCKIEQHLKVKKCMTNIVNLFFFFLPWRPTWAHILLLCCDVWVKSHNPHNWKFYFCKFEWLDCLILFSYENTSYIFSATSLNQKHRYESSLFHSMHIHGCTVAHWPSNLIRATSPQSRTIAVSLILNEECL